MPIIAKYRPGEFCWADLGTPDVPRAIKFYEGLFGWKMKGVSAKGGPVVYWLAQLRGKDVAGIYPMAEERKRAKATPFWLPYISAASVDNAVKQAKAARGKLCMGPSDVTDKGRTALLRDPSGSTFAIWQARKHKGAGLAGIPGTICWHDLGTVKRKAAAKFYERVFRWQVSDQDFSGNKYHLFKLGKEGVGGMWPEPMRGYAPCWITHWRVADCGKSVAKAKRLGGKVLIGAMKVPGMCTFAILADPQGASFGIIEFER